jgi:hypothetical protein
MNVTNFIFQLLHICNLPTLSILSPFRSPCTPFADCAHLFPIYENTTSYYMDSSTDLADTLDISSINFLHPKSRTIVIITHLQIENKDYVHRWIYDLFFILIILHLWFLYFTSFIVLLCIKICLLNSTCILFTIYWHLLFFFLNYKFHVFIRFELILIDQHKVNFKLLNGH